MAENLLQMVHLNDSVSVGKNTGFATAHGCPHMFTVLQQFLQVVALD